MKALSIRQPWAWAIIHAGKDIENRTWHTNFTGRVLIHAAKKLSPIEFADAAMFIEHDLKIDIPHFDTFRSQCGGVIGSVDIIGCTKKSDSPWFFGPFGFILKNPEATPFKPLRGQLGFFDITSDF